jgi:hypothetical protein
LSSRGLCDELITRPEESYRLWCVVVCDLETLRMRRPWHAFGCSATEKYIYIYNINTNKMHNSEIIFSVLLYCLHPTTFSLMAHYSMISLCMSSIQ